MAMCSFADRFSMFDVTPVENLFIEEYMLRAPGDYVKVYIYGLRLCYHPVKEASVTSIARALGLEEKTVMDAFAYWERVGVLRRTGDDGKPQSKKLTFDKLVINLDSYELIVDGKKIDTPPKEMELLYHLAATPNRVYTRNQLLDEVWGFDYFGDSRTVDVHIKRLREKLEGVSDKWALKTVWGLSLIHI